jgi:hypothetical protein
MAKPYNDRKFLIKKGRTSMSCYHAKIYEDGNYRFRIHDCITGIRLRGDLNDPIERKEAFEKIRNLEEGLRKFRKFLEKEYPCDTK